jgi:hypothetical protein
MEICLSFTRQTLAPGATDAEGAYVGEPGFNMVWMHASDAGVSKAMDADISVCWSTFVRALLKEAIDAVSQRRQTHLLQLHKLGAF